MGEGTWLCIREGQEGKMLTEMALAGGHGADKRLGTRTGAGKEKESRKECKRTSRAKALNATVGLQWLREDTPF